MTDLSPPAASRERTRRDRSKTDLAVRWTEFGITVLSLLVAVAALITSAAVSAAQERAAGPIIEVAADNGTGVQWRVDGRIVGTVEYQVLVLVNRGRTEVDVLRVAPLSKGGDPLGERVFFSTEYCDKPGHATIRAGASLVIVSLPLVADDPPYSWDVLLATGTETVKLERRGASSDPADIADSYAADAMALVKACAPELVPAGLD